MIRLHDSKLSGNSWKIRLCLRHLGIPFERVTLNLAEGAHKADSFTGRNRFKRVPVLELEDGRNLAESNAILLYLTEGTSLLPADAVERAKVVAWLFYEQADLMRFLAFPRFYANTGQSEAFADVIAHYRSLGEAGLDVIEHALEGAPWLNGDLPSVADFSVYPYIRLSPEGGYALAGRPAINNWMAHFEALPGFEPIVPAPRH
ncbi:glutathione S-transferase family protein [Lichenihabitans psoromatis]|uniref:glutathione S-transferase family protein n=1 Tax=Lichenihabitans psoromatis TaxID=2528642 RepID=UPI0010362C7C|nr:glutathione S-transferase family protein [Lichenihabitans psoromatis]